MTKTAHYESFSSEGYFFQLVEQDLKSSVIEPHEELIINIHLWRYHLLQLKRKTETQFTSCNTRIFNAYKSFCNKKINLYEYNNLIMKEKEWKVNATRFIQQIESRLQFIKSL